MEVDFSKVAKELVRRVGHEAKSRGVRIANALRNAELEVLRGQRSGRLYHRPGSSRRYRASAPGESPAVRSGSLRRSWMPEVSAESSSGRGIEVKPAITTNLPYAPILQDGGKKMAARPYKEKIITRAQPNIERIMSEPILK